MLIFKSKWFTKWTDKEGLADESLKMRLMMSVIALVMLT
jgi:hypothetical protein